jgi:hypothetical protein
VYYLYNLRVPFDLSIVPVSHWTLRTGVPKALLLPYWFTGISETIVSAFLISCSFFACPSNFRKRLSSIRFHQNPSNENRAVPYGQTDGRKDRHDEANSRSSQFCERVWKLLERLARKNVLLLLLLLLLLFKQSIPETKFQRLKYGNIRILSKVFIKFNIPKY